MAIIFPINPNIGQSLYLEDTRYVFDGVAWSQSVTNSLGSRNSKKFTSVLNQVQYQCQFSVLNAEIFVNGIKLDSSDYVVNNDGLVTLNSTLDVGTNVEVVGYGIYDILHEVYFRQSTEPENPVDGALWFNTETNEIKCYNEISQTWIVPLANTEVFNTTDISTAVIDSFSSSIYRSVEYTITCSTASSFMMIKALIIHNGITSFITMFGELGNNLGVFETRLNSGNVELLFTPNVNGVQVKFNKTLTKL